MSDQSTIQEEVLQFSMKLAEDLPVGFCFRIKTPDNEYFRVCWRLCLSKKFPWIKRKKVIYQFLYPDCYFQPGSSHNIDYLLRFITEAPKAIEEEKRHLENAMEEIKKRQIS